MERIVTYSPAYTLVPTYECFNRCTYCNFRRNPGEDEWMSLEAARQILIGLQGKDVIEILILSGEVHPKSVRRQDWFERIYQLGELALEMGFLPHTNVGPLSYEEMAQLKQVNVSMGLMVEQVTPDLLKTVHAHAPSKLPEVRLEQLEFAGRLRIPFTTGILLGLGETAADWAESLRAIAQSQQTHGHIQEVILQPHQPGESQLEVRSPCHGQTLLQAVQIAKEILPSDVSIQIPPNLIQSDRALLDCIAAGAEDLGGIGPIDEVNPDYEHRDRELMAELLKAQGWTLRQRLPIYQKYDSWIPQKLQLAVQESRVTSK
ncbi:MAG: 7,8-didemethyl-8-hydroxy-5-deazariboflavin synthase subunit CofG [Leptolyngbya foveolarum]|uniref:7,8-didemethyl-8-hydroxy-5-deazariboflavin synthase n=1 Tax=Leptolyngbya foveolarum TaxID=47253 RepID=A0A2W4VND8_9CYAN|nr:MAG: 7,8-didemethyl-8-hydroxy-5-deazariboflavin synthase subunit CofG [Leptolyngbya foveolarum]